MSSAPSNRCFLLWLCPSTHHFCYAVVVSSISDMLCLLQIPSFPLSMSLAVPIHVAWHMLCALQCFWGSLICFLLIGIAATVLVILLQRVREALPCCHAIAVRVRVRVYKASTRCLVLTSIQCCLDMSLPSHL